MENIAQYKYDSIDEYHHFKSFEEIKNTLNHFELLYFKDRKFLFLKFKKPFKNKAISKLRRSLSRSIFTFIFNNHDSISDQDLLFISKFYSKYFIHKRKKTFNLFYYINPINIFYILEKKIDKKLITYNFYFDETDFNYCKKYYWLFSLIIIFDNKLLINNFFSHLPNNNYFYYYYIVFYFERYYLNDFIIKNYYFFEHILLNLGKNNIESIKNHMNNDDYNTLIDLIKHAQEKQNLKNNLENF